MRQLFLKFRLTIIYKMFLSLFNKFFSGINMIKKTKTNNMRYAEKKTMNKNNLNFSSIQKFLYGKY